MAYLWVNQSVFLQVMRLPDLRPCPASQFKPALLLHRSIYCVVMAPLSHGLMDGKGNLVMSLTQMILFVIFSLYLTKFGEFCEMMVASGSILLTLLTTSKVRRAQQTHQMAVTVASLLEERVMRLLYASNPGSLSIMCQGYLTNQRWGCRFVFIWQ